MALLESTTGNLESFTTRVIRTQGTHAYIVSSGRRARCSSSVCCRMSISYSMVTWPVTLDLWLEQPAFLLRKRYILPASRACCQFDRGRARCRATSVMGGRRESSARAPTGGYLEATRRRCVWGRIQCATVWCEN